MALEFSTVATANDSNNSTCELYGHRKTVTVLISLLYSILCITGIPGNILAFYIVLYNKSKLNSTMIYLINLTAADLLFTLSLPARIVYYSYGFYWSLRELMCKIISCIFFMNTYVSIAFMLCISVDRYLAVIHPMKSVNLRSVSVVKSVCAGVWVVIFLQTALTFFTQELVKREGSHQTCMEFSSFEKSEYLPLILCGCLVSYYIPFAVIIFSYSCISLKLYQMRKQNLSGGTSNRAQNYRSQIVVLAVLVVFLVCFTPYHIGLTQHVVKMLIEEPICKTRQDFQSNETGKHIPEELEEICFQGTESVEEHNPKGFVQNKLFL
ncbi:G-protein coupled receptor 183-like [Callorhinchus milii]|uniref:G-protein coupled receptor 183-like n=1 Tax=Callorhinchus milii TaxID=7868 RepID=UPI001C3F8A03|nr:G-protein coupled receptor 183-like [Callorhinchus milii]